MSEIKRYDITSADGYTSIVEEESKIGNYVKYDDIKHLLNTIAQQPTDATCKYCGKPAPKPVCYTCQYGITETSV